MWKPKFKNYKNSAETTVKTLRVKLSNRQSLAAPLHPRSTDPPLDPPLSYTSDGSTMAYAARLHQAPEDQGPPNM